MCRWPADGGPAWVSYSESLEYETLVHGVRHDMRGRLCPVDRAVREMCRETHRRAPKE